MGLSINISATKFLLTVRYEAPLVQKTVFLTNIVIPKLMVCDLKMDSVMLFTILQNVNYKNGISIYAAISSKASLLQIHWMVSIFYAHNLKRLLIKV